MKKNFVENQWGYDVKKTNPFWIALYNLRETAKEEVGEENVLDLSRGDPGYGFSPNVRSREFYSYLLNLDTLFNNFETHFVYNKKSYSELKTEIDAYTRELYSAEKAEKMLSEFDVFMSEILRISQGQNLGYNERDVLFHLFKYASVSGGCYHDPQGEEICRAVAADFYSKELDEKVIADDLVSLRGVSDGIGTFFKLMGKEGIGFLQEGDVVLSTSPAYAPYNAIFANRGLEVVSVSVDHATGDMNEASLKRLEEFQGRIKVFSLIDPNNPTGLTSPEPFQKRLAEYAEKHDAIILTDEVYSSFFKNMHFIYPQAKKRTLRLNARSKIERATGLRYGDILIPAETNKYLSEQVLADYLDKGVSLKRAILLAKAPGGINGEFMHVTFVSGPSQFLGMCHIIFGAKERAKYVGMVEDNTKTFAEVLGIPYTGNSYYSVFDLNDIANDEKKALPAEEKFYQLAKRGVVLIPAYKFYSEEEKKVKNVENMARACLPNLTLENIKKAAQITKEYLQS